MSPAASLSGLHGAPVSDLRAPFPWFGGKRRVAHLVWPRFGNVSNYVEPFAGSLAVLLARPEEWAPRNETVNDLDCYLANFWRAIARAPEEVARWADWPVNEADLHARHRWLHGQEAFRERMHSDPEHFDARVAGWWVWGISCWIGDNWCSPEPNRSLPDLNRPRGVSKMASDGSGLDGRRPCLRSGTGGVHVAGLHAKMPRAERGGGKVEVLRNRDSAAWAKRPDIRKGGRGIQRAELLQKRPLLKRGGAGLHSHRSQDAFPGLWAQIPDVSGSRGASGRGVHAKCAAGLYEYMGALAARLRRVRVCCGDWARILGPSPTVHIGVTAVFLDPPYGAEDRDKVYNHDSLAVAGAVRDWCADRGADRRLRIALCGYEGEHNALEDMGWEKVKWRAAGGYGARNKDNRNGSRERIWFSPGCLPPAEYVDLFASGGGAVTYVVWYFAGAADAA